MKGLRRAWLAAACIAFAAAAAAQGTPAACPASGAELPLQALFGDWEARIDGTEGVAKVKLDQHPDYAGVRGTITRGGDGAPATVSQLAGDIDDDGMLSLDESLDGHAISGVWLGALQPASCGRQFKGVWRDAANDSTHAFVLDRTGNSAPDR
jgi:hypothetical protein